MPAESLAFTTRDLSEPSRRRALLGLVDRGLLPVEPLDGRTPRVDLVKWHLPGASILRGGFAGVRQRGDAGAADDLFVGINLTGSSVARQGRRDVPVGAGEALVVDLRGGAFTVVRPGPNRLIGLRVPRHAAGVGRLDGPPLRVVSARQPALGLLARYLDGALDGPLPPPGVAEVFVAHVTDLVALALNSDNRSPAAIGSVRAARLATIKADIERRLTDASLSPASIAARHGISLRYLHKLFEYDGRTYSRFVLDRRLELARRWLGDPRRATRTVSAIASDAGFGDLSYFNRTFRRRYGTTPSDARAVGPGCDGASTAGC